MSKKSRKRNKRILAVLGVGAAAAMAAKKKRDAVISDGDKNDGGFRKKAKSEPRGPQELGLSTAKKDTAVKTKKNIPQETKVNTSSKRSNAETAGKFINKINDKKSAESGMQFVTPPSKKKLDLIRGNAKPPSMRDGSKRADGYTTKALPSTNIIKQYKSGGRAGYISGGSSVKKSMGKALRGGGKVMR